MHNFINVEIARHCPNPNARSQLMIDDIPLILWQVLLIAERESYSSAGVISSISQLVTAASMKLSNGGVSVAEGDLVRKVCGPLLARYSALCVSRRWKDANATIDFIRPTAELVFCKKLRHILSQCPSGEAQDLIRSLSTVGLAEVLAGDDASLIISGQTTCAKTISPAIKLGRTLFP